MRNSADNIRRANWICMLAGVALVAGGIVILSRVEFLQPQSDDPIAEAQRMLLLAQGKVSEIETGLRSARETPADRIP